MSLDIYLYNNKTIKCDCGKVHEIEPDSTIFNINITHNMTAMADYLGVYGYLWRPEENGVNKAEQLIVPLTQGIKLAKEKPNTCKVFNASNGWGTYDTFIPCLELLLEACILNPESKIEVSR